MQKVAITSGFLVVLLISTFQPLSTVSAQAREAHNSVLELESNAGSRVPFLKSGNWPASSNDVMQNSLDFAIDLLVPARNSYNVGETPQLWARVINTGSSTIDPYELRGYFTLVSPSGSTIEAGYGYSTNWIEPGKIDLIENTDHAWTILTDAEAGLYTLRVVITSMHTGLSRTGELGNAFSINAAPAPDFQLSISPTSQVITQGLSTTFEITVVSDNGWTESVSLSVSGLPSDATSNLSPNPVVPTATSTLSVTTSKSTGEFLFVVVGDSRGRQHTGSATLIVEQSPQGQTLDFSIDLLVPAKNGYDVGETPQLWARVVNVGSTAIDAYDLEGQFSVVSPSGTDIPAGLGWNSMSMQSSQISVIENTDNRWTIPDNAQPGTYSLRVNVRSHSTGVEHSKELASAFSVNAPQPSDFALEISPTSQVITQGLSTTFEITVRSLNGWTEPVALSVSGLPFDATSDLNPNPVTPTAKSTLQIATSTSIGQYNFVIVGDSGGRHHTSPATLIVEPSQQPGFKFTISASQSSVTVQRGQAVDACTVTVSLTSGPSGRVDLSLVGLPSTVGTYAFSPPYDNPPFTATLSIGTFPGGPEGDYTLTIIGSGGGETHSTTLIFTVTAEPPSGSFKPYRSSFVAGPAGSSIQASLGYENSLGEDVVVMFVISIASSGDVVDGPTDRAPDGTSGKVGVTSKSLAPDTYRVSWWAFRASDTSYSNPITWSTSDEMKTVQILPPVSPCGSAVGDLYRLSACAVAPDGSLVDRALLTSFSGSRDLTLQPGQALSFTVSYQISQGSNPTEIDQLMFVSSWGGWPPSSDEYWGVYSDIPPGYPGTTGSASFSLSVPSTLGVYYLWFVFDANYGYDQAASDFRSQLSTPAHVKITVTGITELAALAEDAFSAIASMEDDLIQEAKIVDELITEYSIDMSLEAVLLALPDPFPKNRLASSITEELGTYFAGEALNAVIDLRGYEGFVRGTAVNGFLMQARQSVRHILERAAHGQQLSQAEIEYLKRVSSFYRFFSVKHERYLTNLRRLVEAARDQTSTEDTFITVGGLILVLIVTGPPGAVAELLFYYGAGGFLFKLNERARLSKYIASMALVHWNEARGDAEAISAAFEKASDRISNEHALLPSVTPITIDNWQPGDPLPQTTKDQATIPLMTDYDKVLKVRAHAVVSLRASSSLTEIRCGLRQTTDFCVAPLGQILMESKEITLSHAERNGVILTYPKEVHDYLASIDATVKRWNVPIDVSIAAHTFLVFGEDQMEAALESETLVGATFIIRPTTSGEPQKVNEISVTLDAYFSNTPCQFTDNRVPTREDIFRLLDEYFEEE